MRLDFLRRWCNAMITFFTEKQGEMYAIVPQSSRSMNIGQDHEEALKVNRLKDRQKEAFTKLKESGKSCLDGYKAPEGFVGDRIDVHFRKENVVQPTEEKRKPRPLEVRSGQKASDRRTTAR